MRTREAAIAETHTAVIVLVGDLAYKLKKPVDLGFLDFTSRRKRARACAREVELNRRLSPDVYLGVADVWGPDGTLCDHLVVMRRMPADRRLATLARAGADLGDGVVELARLLAGFHARAERSRSADDAARPAALRRRWADNTEGLLHHGAGLLDAGEVARATHSPRTTWQGGSTCSSGGSRRAGRSTGTAISWPTTSTCWTTGRGSSTASSSTTASATATRSPTWRSWPWTSNTWAGRIWPRRSSPPMPSTPATPGRRPWRTTTSPIGPRCGPRSPRIRSAQGDAGAAADAQDLLALCCGHLDAGTVRLVVVGGLPGTGKSTLAAGLGDRLSATVLRSDEIRKELAGMDPRHHADASYRTGLYDPEMTGATYDVALDRAGIALAGGESVVLDASWLDGHRRQQVRELASTHYAVLTELRCEAPTDLAERRMSERRRVAQDPSDATPEIAAAMRRDADPWPEATGVDTARTPAAALATALATIADPRPADRAPAAAPNGPGAPSHKVVP